MLGILRLISPMNRYISSTVSPKRNMQLVFPISIKFSLPSISYSCSFMKQREKELPFAPLIKIRITK